jgi:predicted mannosyl-3-phosphoglycerate phosphatase (HAD superfamily)
LKASRSGEWITITRGADKGVAANHILALAERLDAAFASTVAVGNAANDAPLLAATERRFAIRNPRRGHDPALLSLDQVELLSSSGARAWREMLAMLPSIGRR